METVLLLLQASVTIHCKYLTYKEWKLSGLVYRGLPVICVSTLPIRNGNIISNVFIWFKSYLFRCVSTLPIRNGNSIRFSIFSQLFWKSSIAYSKYLTYKEWKPFLYSYIPTITRIVSTLPIRNGNEMIVIVCGVKFIM